MLYDLEYLPVARADMLEIARYISQKLKNPAAAERVVVALVDKAESLKIMPYLNPVYIPIRPLKHEYRKVRVNNYLMFYWIDEDKKIITITRVIYKKRDYEKHLE